MQTDWTIDLIWWISVVELPTIGTLFYLLWRGRREAEQGIDETHRLVDHGLAAAREALSAYKLEVAKSYASLSHLKEVEGRLTRHLIRIENKLDSFGGTHHEPWTED